MTHRVRLSLILFSVIFLSGTVFSEEFKVLATNSWTAAFASAAGVKNAAQLAPASMNHPPEYELKPSDVRKVHDADFLIYAGYEVLMRTILESFDKPDDELIRIRTSYHPDVLKTSVIAIAGVAGDLEEAGNFLISYNALIDTSVLSLKELNLHGVSVLVHFHQKPIAEALGFNILGVFGPAPLKAGELIEYGNLNPRFIIDNGHNPIAGPISEVTGVEVVELVNFPGGEDSEGRIIPPTLDGVLGYNLERLLEAAGEHD